MRAPPSPTHHADHTSKLANGTWARSTGPVAWLSDDEHGAKHGKEGPAAAKRKREESKAASKAQRQT